MSSTTRHAAGWLLLLPLTVAAEDIAVQAPITEVTLYNDRAAVTRTITTAVPAGDHRLLVEGLPANLDDRSLWVRGAADGKVTLGSVELQTQFSTNAVQDEEQELEQAIQTLEDQRRALQDEIAAFNVQLAFIKSLGEGQKDDSKLSPGSWAKAWESVGKGAKATLDGIRGAAIQDRSLQQEVTVKRQRLNQIRTGRRSTATAAVRVSASRPVFAHITLTYQVAGASWQPAYDARLDSERSSLALTLAGQVRQQTGESWEDVELTLSTARPSAGTGVAELHPWYIDFLRRQVSRPSARRAPSAAPSAMMAEEPMALSDKRPMVAAEPATAQTIASTFNTEYRIPGRVSVASDNAPHRFPVLTHDLGAKLAVHAAPKRAKQGYLYATARYQGDAPLLPGQVSLYRDGMYTGSTHVSMLRPDEEVMLAFGADDKIGVEYKLLEDKREQEGLMSKKIKHKRRYHISLTNRHARPIEVEIRDQLPVARNGEIQVDLMKDTTPPSETNVEERSGVLAWRKTLQAGETLKVHFGYHVTYPPDQTVSGL